MKNTEEMISKHNSIKQGHGFISLSSYLVRLLLKTYKFRNKLAPSFIYTKMDKWIV